jgi:hypothetical protein
VARILLALSEDIYVRNYLRTDALSTLRERHDVSIVAPDGLALSAEIGMSDGFAGFYSRDSRLDRRHLWLFQILMWRYRRKSRTFFYRWMRGSRLSEVNFTGSWLAVALRISKWAVWSVLNPRWIFLTILGSAALFPLAFRFLRSRLLPNRSLQSLVRNGMYDVIVFPSAAYDSMSVDLVRISEDLGIPSVCLIDNWDNLSSKTLFWARPTLLGVWGEQARDQAVTIHGFDRDAVVLLGTPRFEGYFHFSRTGALQRIYADPYVLFVGSAMPFDEIGSLHEIEKALVSLGRPDLSVVYRPHPWQQKRRTDATFRPLEFRQTQLDVQIEVAYSRGVRPETTDPGFQPDLAYYPSLLFGAEVVVGPLTTMLLEASLCQRPVVALSYADGHHFSPPKRYLTHFDGVDRVAGFTFCDDRAELKQKIRDALAAEVDAEDYRATTQYYLFRDELSYSQRLNNLVQKALDQNLD